MNKRQNQKRTFFAQAHARAVESLAVRRAPTVAHALERVTEDLHMEGGGGVHIFLLSCAHFGVQNACVYDCCMYKI